jgi:alpha-ribazole phosphatase
MTALWVVRHAPVDALGRCYGRSDVEVLVPAETAARTVLAALDGVRVALVWSSPARRCQDLAERLAETIGIPLAVDSRLQELSFGAWEGRRWSDLEREDGERLRAWISGWERGAPPGGECISDLESRVGSWLSSLDQVTQLVVTHAGVIRALRVLIDRRSWAEAMADVVPHLVPASFELPATSAIEGALER